MNHSQYDELIGTIYDAALMPQLWGVFLEQIADLFHSRGTLLYLVDFANHSSICRSDDISFIHSVRIAPDAVHDYEQHYSKVNVWLEHSKNLPIGVPISTAALFPEDDLGHTEWYNDWLKPNGYYRSLVGHLMQQETLTVRMSIFRDKHHHFTQNEITLFARLMPHVRRSCQFYKKLSELQCGRRADIGLLNRLPLGIVLFDKFGHSTFVNQSFERLARNGQGLGLDTSGRCLTGNAEQTRDLRRRIKCVLDDGRSLAMNLQLTKAGPPLSAVILPLTDHTLPLFGSGPSAVMFISDPNTPLELNESLLAECYRLTSAEAKLACALAAGQSLSGYETSRGISHNTGKTQLKQVLAKTGTHRQADLIQLITRSFGNLPSASESE